MKMIKGGKSLWHTAPSVYVVLSVFLCLTLCACKAEREEQGKTDRPGYAEDLEENAGTKGSSGLGENAGSEGSIGEEDKSASQGSTGEEDKSASQGSTGEGDSAGLQGNPSADISDLPAKTPEELLEEQPIDDLHDAFLVENGGKVGTVLVTVQREEALNSTQFSVWDPNHMEEPIQILHSNSGLYGFGKHLAVDANFDGWTDFGYLKEVYQGRESWNFWFWDERQCQFVDTWLGFHFFNPVFEKDAKIVRCVDPEGGVGRFYRWLNGTVTKIRDVAITWRKEKADLTVIEDVGGIPVQVFWRSYGMDSKELPEQWDLWCDLSYHGEPGSASHFVSQGLPEGTVSAFVVDTGGKVGELLVTVQPCEADDGMNLPEPEISWYTDVIKISVWNPADLGEPRQTMFKYVEKYWDHYEILDANFDGYMDFSWMHFLGNQPTYYYLWLWDEEQGCFVEEPTYSDISSPSLDAEKKMITGWSRSSAADDGSTTFYQWIGGELLCMRHIMVWWDADAHKYIMTVEDRVDGEMTEVYRAQFKEAWDFDAERRKWEEMDYHGEE